MAWLKSRPYAAACAIFIAITAPLALDRGLLRRAGGTPVGDATFTMD